MLKEKAVYYYKDLGRSCSEAMLLAANDVYDLKFTDAEVQLFVGFRTGMGCGSTCGALVGAIGVLSRKYAGRDDLKELCAKFVAEFEKKLACGSIECSVLEAKYKTEEARCSACVPPMLAPRTGVPYIWLSITEKGQFSYHSEG